MFIVHNSRNSLECLRIKRMRGINTDSHFEELYFAHCEVSLSGLLPGNAWRQ